MTEPTGPSHGAPMVPSFETRDPDKPGFWNERFDKQFTPWDQAGVPDAFKTFVDACKPDTAVLIPGCGSAYEAAWLATHGHRVRAIDFSPSAVEVARHELGPHASLVEEADFFAYRPPFDIDWIYERAFLCALPLARRNDYIARMTALLRPGALLAGFFFLGATPKGPPFGIERDDLEALFAPYFERLADEPVSGSIAVFEGRERWMTWRRKTA